MNSRLSVACVLCVALLGSYVYAQFGTKPAELSTIKVKDDLFVVYNDLVPGNTTVLVTNQGLILVDNKFEIDFDNLMAQVRKISNQPIRYVINTHYHADHSGGNPKMQAQNVQVVASERARRKMVETNQPGAPNVTLENNVRLFLGGKRVEVHHFGRAHTDGDVVAYFPDHRVVAMGDMFTVGDGLPPLVDYPGGGSTREWPRSLDGALTDGRHVHGRRWVAAPGRLPRWRQHARMAAVIGRGADARLRDRDPRPRQTSHQGRPPQVSRQSDDARTTRERDADEERLACRG